MLYILWHQIFKYVKENTPQAGQKMKLFNEND